MSKVWETQRERSTPRTLRLVIWLALHLGRAFTRLLLYPIVAYFLVTAGAPGRASHHFLRHALGREPGWMDRARHWYTFAAVLLDRVFLLGDRTDYFAVQVEQETWSLRPRGRGTAPCCWCPTLAASRYCGRSASASRICRCGSSWTGSTAPCSRSCSKRSIPGWPPA